MRKNNNKLRDSNRQISKERAPLLSGKLDRAKLKQIEAYEKEQRIKEVR